MPILGRIRDDSALAGTSSDQDRQTPLCHLLESFRMSATWNRLPSRLAGLWTGAEGCSGKLDVRGRER